MTNNDILRRLRYTFNFNDKKMVLLLKSAGLEVSTETVVNWLKKEDDSEFSACNDNQLAYFLNGLIIDRRNPSEDHKHEAEKRLNNNIILVKLKIALSLKSDDIVDIMKKTNLSVSKTELSAFLRKPDHKNFRRCQDQFLRNFLLGIDKRFNVKRPDKYVVNKEAEAKNSHIYEKSLNKFSWPKAEPAKTPATKPKATKLDKTKSEGEKKVFVNTNAQHSDKKQTKKVLTRKK